MDNVSFTIEEENLICIYQQRAHPAADARQPAGAGRATGSGRRLTAGKRVTVKTEHGLGRMLPDPSVYRITKTGNPDKDVARIPI